MNNAGYKRLLTGRFDVLRRSTTTPTAGRPDVTWSVGSSNVHGRINTLEAHERHEMDQFFSGSTHKIYLEPDADVQADDILRPAGEASGAAYAVQGIILRQGKAHSPAVQQVLVEKTKPDDASDYYEAS